MSTTNTLRIAAFAIFSMAIAAFATQPAQAKFGMGLGYKYVAVPTVGYDAHVAQIDLRWTIKGGGQGYRDGGKRPKETFGFGLAIGGNSRPPITDCVSDPSGYGEQQCVLGNEASVSISGGSVYFALPLIYEYVFDFGLGISGGVTIPIMYFVGGSVGEGFGGSTVSFGVGSGIGLSDVGLSYNFKNGLNLYARGNIGYATFFGAGDEGIGSKRGVMWGTGGGLGYWF